MLADSDMHIQGRPALSGKKRPECYGSRHHRFGGIPLHARIVLFDLLVPSIPAPAMTRRNSQLAFLWMAVHPVRCNCLSFDNSTRRLCYWRWGESLDRSLGGHQCSLWLTLHELLWGEEMISTGSHCKARLRQPVR